MRPSGAPGFYTKPVVIGTQRGAEAIKTARGYSSLQYASTAA
jgi:hypothetical protein